MSSKPLTILAFAVIAATTTWLAPPAFAQPTEPTVPFIKGEYWKQNISFEAFRENPRLYYRSEGAFQLSRQYGERVIGQEMTDAEFVALLRSEQARAVACEGDITNGALEGDGFFWFTRLCREDEEIIQLSIGEQWVDFLSLGCLNAVEDKTPVAPPVEPEVRYRKVTYEVCPPSQPHHQTVGGEHRGNVGVVRLNCLTAVGGRATNNQSTIETYSTFQGECTISKTEQVIIEE